MGSTKKLTATLSSEPSPVDYPMSVSSRSVLSVDDTSVRGKRRSVGGYNRFSRGYVTPVIFTHDDDDEESSPRTTSGIWKSVAPNADNNGAILQGQPVDKYEEHRPLVGSDEVPKSAASSRIALFPIWHPKREPYRWSVLFVACLFSVGSYFTYDSVGVIQTEIEQHFHITASQFGLLYSVYTFPNIILPFFGGFLLDYVGLPIGTTLACSFVTIGALMVAISPSYNFYMMLAGRFIFGIGAETSYVAQNTICCAWFKDGSQLALAMGLTVSAGRLGSYFTFAANARVVEHFNNFRAALWLGAAFASLSFIAGVVYLILHYAALRIIKGSNVTLDIPQSQPDIKVSQALKFSPVFYLAMAVCCAYYSAIFPFQSTAVSLLEETHDYDNIKAANYISLLPLTSFFMSPVFGFIVDRVGKRVYFATAGLLVMIPAFGLLMAEWWPPVASMIAIGLVFALVPAALWPCIPLLVEEKYIGTSFGLISGGLNACLTLFYWLQGNLPKTDGRYGEVMLFSGLAAVGFVFSVAWIIIDKRMGSICNGQKAPEVVLKKLTDSDS